MWWFGTGPLIPHGVCLVWNPALMGLHVTSDLLVALSYYSIPITIAMLLIRRRDTAFGWTGWLFAAFILACGTCHLFDVITLWVPVYGIQGIVKAITAITSAVSAAVIWPLMPKLVVLPSPQILLQQLHDRDLMLDELRQAVSERRQAESMFQQAQKMEAIGQLTGGIAHDFNNLLQVISGNLDLLQANSSSAPETNKRYIARATRNAERGARLTQSLLAFARRQSLRPTVFEVSQCLGHVAEMLSMSLNATLTLRINAPQGLVVEADQNQLETALLNLAINARDAMPNGGSLTIEAAVITSDHARQIAELEDDDYALITVSDTGVGMTPEVCASAFEPFFTTKPLGSGTGLGLSQVYGFVKQSNGHITLSSMVGVGTTVSIYLRLAHRS